MKIGFALSFFQSCLLIRHGFAAPPSPLEKAFVKRAFGGKPLFYVKGITAKVRTAEDGRQGYSTVPTVVMGEDAVRAVLR